MNFFKSPFYYRLAAICLMMLPQVSLACEKCFGAGVDNKTTQGIGMAMLGLLIITIMVLGTITVFFAYMWRRSKLLASGEYSVNEQGVLLAVPRRLVDDNPYS